MISYSRTIKTLIDADVVIAGGGSAGVPAAIAAARNGARTVLLEQHGFAGGIITAVQTAGWDGMHDVVSGRLAVGGLALEIADRLGLSLRDATLEELAADHAVREEGWSGPGSIAKRDERGPLPEDVISQAIDIERFKLVADRMLGHAGVNVLYHTRVIDTVVSDGHVESAIAVNKGGLFAIRAQQFVDATGDADLVSYAGGQYEVAGDPQPMSLHFRVGNVPTTAEVRAKCAAVLRDAHHRGDLGVYGGPWMRRVASNEWLVNAVRYIGHALDPNDITTAERQGREDAWTMFELWREYLPEFKEAFFDASGPVVGARESRRIVGDYTLTAEDILTQRPANDGVCRGAWFLDLHPSDGHAGFHAHRRVPSYPIPYRTLLPVSLENVIVAGRCHAATHEALSSSRVTVTAIGMGQAAGTAASLATKHGVSPRTLDVDRLRETLRSQDAILD